MEGNPFYIFMNFFKSLFQYQLSFSVLIIKVICQKNIQRLEKEGEEKDDRRFEQPVVSYKSDVQR